MPDPNDWVSVSAPAQPVGGAPVNDWQPIGAPEQAVPQTIGTLAKDLWSQINPTSTIKAVAEEIGKGPIDSMIGQVSIQQKVLEEAVKHFKEGDVMGAASRALYAVLPYMGPTLARDADARDALLGQAQRDFQDGKIADSVRKGLASQIPVFGLSINKAGQQASEGNYMGAAGTTAGMAINALLPKATEGATGLLNRAATGVYQKAGGFTPEQAAVGISNELPFSVAGKQRFTSLMDELGKQEQAAVAGGGRVIDAGKVASAANAQVKARMVQIAPSAEELATVDKTTRAAEVNAKTIEPSGMLTGQEALALKKGTYQNLPKNAYDIEGKKSALLQTQEALAEQMNNEIHAHFAGTVPVNAAQSKLLDFKPQFLGAVQDASDLSILGGAARGTISAAIGTIVGGLTKNYSAGGAAAIMAEVLSRPAVAARLAIGVSKLSKIPYTAALAQVTGYADQLKNSQPDQ